ncbi:MAG: DUF6174 domain-containing protein [Chloroflexota bacterium]
MKKIILLLLALILAACSTGTKSEFDTSLEKWQDAGINHYSFELRVICFCPGTDKMPLTVEVQDGEVVSMTYVDGTPVAPEDPQYEFYSRFATIDRLFSELKADLDGAADEVAVTYDPTYGLPVDVNIDMIKEAIDDELALQVTNFQELQ